MTDAIFALDSDGCFTYANPAAAAIFGHPATDLPGRHLWNAFAEVIDADFQRQCLSAMHDGQPGVFCSPVVPALPRMHVRAYPSPDGLTVYLAPCTPMDGGPAHQADILDNVSDAIVSTDLNLLITGWNKAAERIYGWRAAEAIGQQVDLLLQSDFVNTTSTAAARQLMEDGFVQMTVRHQSKTHERLYVECNVTLCRDAQGAAIGSLGILRDVTARVQFEQALRESEERYRTVADYTYDWEFWRGTDGAFVYVSPSCERITGYPPSAFMADAMLFRSLVHPEDQPRIQRHILDIREIFEKVEMDFRLIHRDGSVRWIRHICQPVYGHAGQYLGRRASNRDITERKQIEDDLACARTFLETAVDFLPIPLAFFGPQGEIFRQNYAAQALRKHLGVSSRRVEMQFFDPLTHLMVPEHERPAARALRGESVTAEEYVLMTPGCEQLISALVSAAPIYIGGKITAAVSIIEDITGLKEADRAKDEFLAVLSHELQTPLTSMLGWSAEALQRQTPEFMTMAMEIVHRNAIRQKRLVEEILDMSRLIHRKISLDLAPTDLAAQAGYAVDNMRLEATQRHLRLAFTSSIDPLPILADSSRLQQCISNLLHNSLKFTPAEGTITVECRREGQEALLIVRDTGCGIDPEAIPTLFTVFYQVNRDERTGGLGLGLAVTRGIINLHGGRIWAESAGVGQGSTFCIALPLTSTLIKS